MVLYTSILTLTDLHLWHVLSQPVPSIAGEGVYVSNRRLLPNHCLLWEQLQMQDADPVEMSSTYAPLPELQITASAIKVCDI